MSSFTSSRAAFEHIRNHFNPSAEEVWVLGLNSQMELIFEVMVFRGSLTSCPFHPRDIFRYLITQNACAFILAHNHPSGNLLPSSADVKITKRLHSLAKMMEIPMLDHIIFSSVDYFSFLEKIGSFSEKRFIQIYS